MNTATRNIWIAIVAVIIIIVGAILIFQIKKSNVSAPAAVNDSMSTSTTPGSMTGTSTNPSMTPGTNVNGSGSVIINPDYQKG